MEEDYAHPKLVHPSGSIMEFDVYIEELNLAIEYQGQQHYRPSYGLTKDFADQCRRDEEKKLACKEVFLVSLDIDRLAQHHFD